jgi:hypothetical protein
VSYGTPLPLTVFAIGSVQGFHIDTTFTGLEGDGSAVNIRFTVTRSPITKAFSVIIILGACSLRYCTISIHRIEYTNEALTCYAVMWCLSGGIFIAAMSVFFRERKVRRNNRSLKEIWNPYDFCG